MGEKENIKRYKVLVDYVAGSPGADIPRDLIRVAVSAQDIDLVTIGKGERKNIAEKEDISTAKTKHLGNYKQWTLYLKVDGATNIVLELSPDNGNTYFTPDESPVAFAAAGDKVLKMNYEATDIKLTGSDGTLVTAIVRGIL